MDAAALREVFLAALSPSLRSDAELDPALGARLAQWIADARAEWPDVEVDDASFVAWLAMRLRTDVPFASARDEVRAVDLYLTHACARGDAPAIRAFEARYFRELDALWSRESGRVSLDDARQLLRERLFAARDGAAPRVAMYSGRGGLRGWVRVVAGRVLTEAAQRGRLELPMNDAFFDAVGSGADVELDRFRVRYGAEFKEALRTAIDMLTPRERSLLRLAYVQNARVAEVGAVYGVHGATAARWIADARERLSRSVHRLLAERLRMTPDELNSVFRLIESNLHVTLERYLADGEGPP